MEGSALTKDEQFIYIGGWVRVPSDIVARTPINITVAGNQFTVIAGYNTAPNYGAGALIVKMRTSDGAIVWSDVTNNNVFGHFYYHDICMDPAGNIYAVAEAGHSLVVAGQTVRGQVLVKYNSAHVIQWVANPTKSGRGWFCHYDSALDVVLFGAPSNFATTNVTLANGTVLSKAQEPNAFSVIGVAAKAAAANGNVLTGYLGVNVYALDKTPDGTMYCGGGPNVVTPGKTNAGALACFDLELNLVNKWILEAPTDSTRVVASHSTMDREGNLYLVGSTNAPTREFGS